MARLGWPIGVTMALEMGVFALAAYFMGWIGAPAVAAHAVALQLAALTFMIPLGLGQAATVRVGLALGRGDSPASPAPAGPPGCSASASWGPWRSACGAPAPRWSRCSSPTCRPMRAIALAVSFLRVAAAFQLVDGAQVIGAGMLRGLHDTRWPLIFAWSAIGWSGWGSARGSPSPATGRASASGSALPAVLAAVAVADARPLADARSARTDSGRARLAKCRGAPLTDERGATICAASLALSWREC